MMKTNKVQSDVEVVSDRTRYRLIAFIEVAIAIVVFVCTSAIPGFAGTIYSFSGTLNTVEGTAYPLHVGDQFNGTLTFNENTAPYYSNSNYNAFFDESLRFSVRIEGLTFNDEFIALTAQPHGYLWDYHDNPTSQGYVTEFVAQRASLFQTATLQSDSVIGLQLDQISSQPTGMFPAVGLPDNIALSQFNFERAFYMQEDTLNSQTGMTLSNFRVVGQLETFVKVGSAVPEPSTLVLLVLGALGLMSGIVRRSHLKVETIDQSCNS